MPWWICLHCHQTDASAHSPIRGRIDKQFSETLSLIGWQGSYGLIFDIRPEEITAQCRQDDCWMRLTAEEKVAELIDDLLTDVDCSTHESLTSETAGCVKEKIRQGATPDSLETGLASDKAVLALALRTYDQHEDQPLGQ
ncbi:MAG: hypothetical protein JJ872_13730 [Marivivens sp.]|nr:hypothetical protein [Marivivens sp.]